MIIYLYIIVLVNWYNPAIIWIPQKEQHNLEARYSHQQQWDSDQMKQLTRYSIHQS